MIRAKTLPVAVFLGAILIIWAAFGSLAAGWVGKSPICGPANAKTLLADRRVRIYSQLKPGSREAPLIYGCLVSSGKSRKLSPLPRRSGRGAPLMEAPFALNAPWVAGAVHQQTGLDTSRITVGARDLRSGRRRSCAVGGGDHSPRSRGNVKEIVLKQNGSLAWSGHGRIGDAPGGQFPLPEVVACDSSGEHLLDSGPGVDLHSLKLQGSRLTWTDSGETRSALLH